MWEIIIQPVRHSPACEITQMYTETETIAPEPSTRWRNVYQSGKFKFWQCTETMDHIGSMAYGRGKKSVNNGSCCLERVQRVGNGHWL